MGDVAQDDHGLTLGGLVALVDIHPEPRRIVLYDERLGRGRPRLDVYALSGGATDAERTSRDVGCKIEGNGLDICRIGPQSFHPFLEKHEEVVATIVTLNVDTVAVKTFRKLAIT